MSDAHVTKLALYNEQQVKDRERAAVRGFAEQWSEKLRARARTIKKTDPESADLYAVGRSNALDDSALDIERAAEEWGK